MHKSRKAATRSRRTGTFQYLGHGTNYFHLPAGNPWSFLYLFFTSPSAAGVGGHNHRGWGSNDKRRTHGTMEEGGVAACFSIFRPVEFRAIAKDRNDQADHFAQTLNTITGGQSYAFVTLEPLGGDVGYPFIVEVGDSPLHSVAIQLVRLQVDNQVPTPMTYNLPRMDLAVKQRSCLTQTRIDLTGSKSIVFMIYFDGLNGHWAERTRLQKMNGKWREAIT